VADDLAGFARKMGKLGDELSGAALKRIATSVVVEAKKDADKAVRADLGDTSMSGWRRGRPIPIQARFDVKNESQVEVLPSPRSRGPWRVLNDGRKAGTSRRRRRSGSTRGKNTWDEAAREIERRTPERVSKEVNQAVRRALRG
jgi:hypothetical protein